MLFGGGKLKSNQYADSWAIVEIRRCLSNPWSLSPTGKPYAFGPSIICARNKSQSLHTHYYEELGGVHNGNIVRMEGARGAAYMKRTAAGSPGNVRSTNALFSTDVIKGTPLIMIFSTGSGSVTGSDVLR